MEKALFLTGCVGFIGLNFLRYLYDSGLHKKYKYIYNLDKLGYAAAYNKKEYERVFNLFKNDEPSKLTSLFLDSEQFANIYKFICKDVNSRTVDIVDFASESHVDRSIANPNEIFLANCRIPGDIFSVFKDKIDTYYHISTDEVYGDIPYMFKDDTRSYFSPISGLRPSNPYSASKAAQDLYLGSLARTFKTNVVIIRMANQFGLFQHPEKMIPASILRALRGETIKIYGEGKNCRQWTFVEDTVKAIGALMNGEIREDSLSFPAVVHFADQHNLIDNNQLVNYIVMSLTRHNVQCKIEYINDRLGHDEVYALRVCQDHTPYFSTPFSVALDKVVDSYVERFKNGDFA